MAAIKTKAKKCSVRRHVVSITNKIEVIQTLTNCLTAFKIKEHSYGDEPLLENIFRNEGESRKVIVNKIIELVKSL